MIIWEYNNAKNIEFSPKLAREGFQIAIIFHVKNKTLQEKLRNANSLDPWLFIHSSRFYYIFSISNSINRFLCFLFVPNNTINN